MVVFILSLIAFFFQTVQCLCTHGTAPSSDVLLGFVATRIFSVTAGRTVHWVAGMNIQAAKQVGNENEMKCCSVLAPFSAYR